MHTLNESFASTTGFKDIFCGPHTPLDMKPELLLYEAGRYEQEK